MDKVTVRIGYPDKAALLDHEGLAGVLESIRDLQIDLEVFKRILLQLQET